MVASTLPNNGEESRPPVVYPEWRKRRREDSVRNVVSVDGTSVTASLYKVGTPILKFYPLVMIISMAITYTSIPFDCARAADPSDAPSIPRDVGSTPISGVHSESNHLGDDTDVRSVKNNIVQPTRSSGGGYAPRMTENAHRRGDDEYSSPPLESKANKPKQQRLKVRAVERQRGTNLILEHHLGDRKTSQSEYDAYMHWCEKVLGIQSVVEIREFEYVDHLKLHWDENAEEEYYDPRGFDWLRQYTESVEDDGGHETMLPTKLVRGLAAKYDVQPGDIVISIPLYSLLSVPTTIDHDPVLSRILGPDARKSYGWADTTEYELQLLVLAVLYHRSLGNDSPMSHYVDILLGTPTDSFPFLWSDHELNEKVSDDEVKKLARSIRRHLHEMYDEIMGTLVRAKPEWFAPPSGYLSKRSIEGGNEDGWAYSYENFQWAFAMVISRHHYLPIHDFDDSNEGTPKPTKQTLVEKNESPSKEQIMHETLSSVSEVAPPANQPTDQWVDEAHNEERVVEDDLVVIDDDVTTHPMPIKHSFLAPLADLINFGPPCLTGSYNEAEHAFEFLATCPFSKGQEITFWYSSDCSDVIIANFGFTHPLVPPCESPKDLEEKSNEWRDKAKLLEEELRVVNERLGLLKDAMSVLDSRLISCGCEGKRQTYSSEINQKLRKSGHHQALRQEVRTQEPDQQQLTQQVMEELG
ncbi:hypothetical protein ACHAXA_000594 [Cyclostephanos tholiformis]|uniref:SET domain-containing protein n=1 Tax=Cyclostephanos tholiformis TaxID=382380 RepID=A0ABD3SRE4_9STRA